MQLFHRLIALFDQFLSECVPSGEQMLRNKKGSYCWLISYIKERSVGMYKPEDKMGSPKAGVHPALSLCLLSTKQKSKICIFYYYREQVIKENDYLLAIESNIHGFPNED